MPSKSRQKSDPYARLIQGRTINPNGCWISSLQPSAAGYIYVGQGRGEPKILAHRLSYERNVGPIPDGFDLDHLCRNRSCWNYEHVEPVTRQVNLLRGETLTAEHARAIACPKGHAFDERNTGRSKHGRFCRECRRAYDRVRRPRMAGD